MKEDSYKSLTEINSSLKELKINHNSLLQKHNLQDTEIQSSFKVIEQRFQNYNSELSQIKTYIETTIN